MPDELKPTEEGKTDRQKTADDAQATADTAQHTADLAPGTIITHVPQRAGMVLGFQGLAGEDKPGPSTANFVVPAWKFYGAKLISVYLSMFFTLLGLDATGFIEIVMVDNPIGIVLSAATAALLPAGLTLLWEIKKESDKVVAGGR